MTMRYLSIGLALALALGAAGCGEKKEESESTATEHRESGESVAPPGQTQAEPAPVPAATVPEIWAQIETERSILKTTIESGTLDEVQQIAGRIVTLMAAAATKANAASPPTSEQVNGMVDQVRASAAKLDELSDTGNRTATMAEFNRMNAVLDAFKNVTVAT